LNKESLKLTWTDYKGGTGAMCADIHAQQLDIALLLTEGAVADAIKNNQLKIHSVYVSSPLIWGLHTAADRSEVARQDFKNTRFAISRFGSGSHLMALVDRNQQTLPLENVSWVEVKNIDGAVESLSKHESDVFLWEKFMTAPYTINNGPLKRFAECPTPWPCFVFAVSKHSSVDTETVAKIQHCLTLAIDWILNQKDVAALLANKYHIQHQDAAEWLTTIQWTPGATFTPAILDQVVQALVLCGQIENKKYSLEDILMA
jgi:hypothetical protein